MIEIDTAPSPLALELAWWRTGGWARLNLRSAQDISGFTDLDLRVAVAASSPPVDLTVRLIDRRGNNVPLSGGSPVSALRGSQSPLGKAWGQTLRFSLEGLEGIDLSAITGLELVSRSERGRAWLIDVSARRPGLARPRSHPLPQVSVATLEIPEGGPGPRVEMLPLVIRGEVVRPAVIWVSVSEPEKAPRSYRLVLPAGTTEAAIPITVEGNDQYDPGMSQREYRVALKALSQVTTGEYLGTLRVVDDDPAPTLAFVATRGRVAEGGTLVFTATLSAPLATDVWYSLTLGEVSGQPALWTDDVTPGFLMAWAGWVPEPPTPLWETVYPTINIPAGATTATFEIPTVADGITEGSERITITLQGWDDPLLPVPITLRGTVHDG
jgi:hypothetical protein